MHCETVFDILTQGPFPRGHQSDELVERHLASCHECRQLAETLQPAVQLLHECLDHEPRGHESPGGDETLPSYRGLFAGGQAPAPSITLPQQIDRAIRAGHRPHIARGPSPVGRRPLPTELGARSEPSADAATTTSTTTSNSTIRVRRTGRSWPSRQTVLVVAVLVFGIVLFRGGVATSFRTPPVPNQAEANTADWIRLASIDLQPACLAASERDVKAPALPQQADQLDTELTTRLTTELTTKLVCCSQCHHYGGAAPVSRLAAIVKTCGTCH